MCDCVVPSMALTILIFLLYALFGLPLVKRKIFYSPPAVFRILRYLLISFLCIVVEHWVAAYLA